MFYHFTDIVEVRYYNGRVIILEGRSAAHAQDLVARTITAQANVRVTFNSVDTKNDR